ncbi:MAG: serine hydrolase domain-containing protein [Pseudomonadota bacterium]
MRFSTMSAVSVLIALACGSGSTSAETMHLPKKMPKASAESVGMSTKGLHRIDEMMQGQIDAGRIQGGATIVARRGKVVHFSTHGEMDVVTGRPMEPDALYIMASSEKPVVGVATLMLVEEGLIDLNDPVSKFIPEFANQQVVFANDLSKKGVEKEGKKAWRKNKDAKGKGGKGKGAKSKDDKDGKWDGDYKGKSQRKGQSKGKQAAQQLSPVDTPVTIHHLLTHTSGVNGGGVYQNKEDSPASYVAKVGRAPLMFQPGTRWVYSNVAIHHVLPQIIEIASGTPYHTFVQERVFDPLAMKSTYFQVPSDKMSKVILANDLKKKGGGGLMSTAEDFLHFEQMLLNGGELFGQRLLRPETVRMMGTNQVGDLFANSGKGEKAQKGMGFGYTVAVTLDPIAAGNGRGRGAFGWGGAAGTVTWSDPENELVGVLMLQQPRGGGDFARIISEAIID